MNPEKNCRFFLIHKSPESMQILRFVINEGEKKILEMEIFSVKNWS
jgi:hypothetical protein